MRKIFLIISLLLWTGITAAQAAFDSSEQTGALAQALKQHYALEGSFELTPVSPLGVIAQTPNGIELLEVPINPTPTMLIRARFTKDGQKLADVSAAFRAQWRVNALVARKPMSRGPVDPTSFEPQTVDRLTLRQMPVDPQADLKGYEIANPIAAGTPLTWNILKSQPVVRKGGFVEVVAEEGGLKIATRAVAMHDAGKGESVQMRNLTTNRQFEAYVINENLVQIRL